MLAEKNTEATEGTVVPYWLNPSIKKSKANPCTVAYLPITTVKDSIHTLFGQLRAEEARPNQRFFSGIAHTAGVLASDGKPGVSPLHVHQKATVGQIGPPTEDGSLWKSINPFDSRQVKCSKVGR